MSEQIPTSITFPKTEPEHNLNDVVMYVKNSEGQWQYYTSREADGIRDLEKLQKNLGYSKAQLRTWTNRSNDEQGFKIEGFKTV